MSKIISTLLSACLIAGAIAIFVAPRLQEAE